LTTRNFTAQLDLTSALNVGKPSAAGLTSFDTRKCTPEKGLTVEVEMAGNEPGVEHRSIPQKPTTTTCLNTQVIGSDVLSNLSRALATFVTGSFSVGVPTSYASVGIDRIMAQASGHSGFGLIYIAAPKPPRIDYRAVLFV